MVGGFRVNQESCRFAPGEKILREFYFEAVGVEFCIVRCAIQFVLNEYLKFVLPIHAGCCAFDVTN